MSVFPFSQHFYFPAFIVLQLCISFLSALYIYLLSLCINFLFLVFLALYSTSFCNIIVECIFLFFDHSILPFSISIIHSIFSLTSLSLTHILDLTFPFHSLPFLIPPSLSPSLAFYIQIPFLPSLQFPSHYSLLYFFFPPFLYSSFHSFTRFALVIPYFYLSSLPSNVTQAAYWNHCRNQMHSFKIFLLCINVSAKSCI